jgi:WD40 repeat protein
MNKALLAALAGTLAISPAAVRASSPTAWEMNSYRDFLDGRLNGLSLTRDGRLLLAPKTETLFASGQPIIWSVVQAPDGTLYAATGHRGRVYRIDRSGKAALLWTADQPEVFALALDSKGALYAGTSPDGKIYRIENGKASEYFAPGAKYIWSLAFSRDGALYAGTGDDGRIFRISAAGKGEVWYETGQSHITCLAFDSEGRLLAGSEPNGILYRVTAKDKAFVLYDANLPEIRSIVPAADGAIYTAALGGSMTRRTLGGVASAYGIPSSASVTTTPTSVTVEAQAGIELRPQAESAKPQAPATVPPVQVPQMVDLGNTEKSAIYRINPDNTVESLWSSKDENVYDLLLSADQITFSTDERGRIYRLTPDRSATLLLETEEGETLRLLSTPVGLLAATGDMGKLYRLAGEQSPSGSYESPVHDANSVARWGRLSWLAESPQGSRIAFRTRSGNSARPDKTWSDWSEPLTDPAGSPVRSPNARYIQWKAEFTGSAPAGPALDSVSLAYLPQNTPPAVKSVTVVAQPGTAAAQKPAAAQPQASSSYSITVTDTGDSGAATSGGTPTQSLNRSGSDQLQIVWQADDPDNDRLVYSVFFRGEGEREWKLLKANVSENTYSLDADSLADGRYWFRVVASDSPANAAGTARDAEMISSPTLVDHTPPAVTAGEPRRSGSRVEIEIEAADATSPLRRAEYSVDAAPWVPIEPVEGIIDSERERFVVRLDNLAPGEHLVVFRATDSAGNAGLAKIIVR